MNCLRLCVVVVLSCMLWSAPVSGNDYIFGHVASKTHQNSAALAKGLETGYNVYFKYINEKGGINGKTIGYRNLDDEFNADKTIALTRELAADPKVIAVGGYVGAGPLARIAKENLLPELRLAMIAPLAGDKSIVSAPNFYPFRSGFEDEVNAMVAHAIKTYQKSRVAVVYLNASFGPFLGGKAEEEAKRLGVPLVGKIGYDITPAKLDQSIKDSVATLSNLKPDAVILLAPGKAGIEFIRQLRQQFGTSATLYSVSVLQAPDVIAALTPQVAKGVIFAQSVPFPFAGTTKLVLEYLRLMKKYQPNETPSFAGLEGFAGAKILVAGIRRAGPNANRDSVNTALQNLGKYDLGDVFVNYTKAEKQGWGSTELTIVTAKGSLAR
jgi:branched-chain amino acid transport system substrate-binding protein